MVPSAQAAPPVAPQEESFFDRRSHDPDTTAPGRERRQFVDGREDLSPDAQELADAIDHYKLQHRRRFITYEEMLHVVKLLGYQK
jgi:hypothetical protein